MGQVVSTGSTTHQLRGGFDRLNHLVAQPSCGLNHRWAGVVSTSSTTLFAQPPCLLNHPVCSTTLFAQPPWLPRRPVGSTEFVEEPGLDFGFVGQVCET